MVLANAPRVSKNLRDNLRCIVYDPVGTKIMYDQLSKVVPATFVGWALSGVYSKMRYYRNDPGHFFCMHYDAPMTKPWPEQSFVVVLINLNEGYVGGMTSFHDM